MGLKDLFGKSKGDDTGAKKGLSENDFPAVQMTAYECVIAAYYQDRDPEKAWPLSWFSEADPLENLEELAEMLPEYFEYDAEDEENNIGIMYISPESTGIKVLDKNDLKNELALMMSVAGKAASRIDDIMKEYGVLSEYQVYIGCEFGGKKIQPEAILIPDSNIVLLHCELTLKYGITDVEKYMASLE